MDDQNFARKAFEDDVEIKEEPLDGEDIDPGSSEDEPLVYHIERKKKRHELSDDPFKDLVEIKEEPLDEVLNDGNVFVSGNSILDSLDKANVSDNPVKADENFDGNGCDVGCLDFEVEIEDMKDENLVKKEKKEKVKLKKKKKKKKHLYKRMKSANYDNTCAICLIDYDDKAELKLHMQQEHYEINESGCVTCPFCEKRYNTTLGLKSHMRRKHSGSVECEKCAEILQNQDEYLAHRKVMHGIKKEGDSNEGFNCQECHVFFLNADRLRIHLIRKHNYDDKKFKHKCQYCDMTYENQASLGVHVRRKHKAKKEPLECSFCTEIFDKDSEHAQHMLSVHKGGDFVANKEARCEICLMLFNSKSRLRNHMKNRHNKSIQAFKHQCPKCDASYDKILSLNSHMERKHSKPKAEDDPTLQNLKQHHTTVICHMCSMVFASDNRLKTHLQKKHNVLDDTFKFGCTECSIRFTNIMALNRHVSKKHGPNSLYCMRCDKYFDNKTDFNTHEHLPPSFSCHVCKKVYHKEGTLQAHLFKEHQIGTESEKHFFCHECGEAFSSTRQVNYHIQKQHKNYSCKCQLCEFSCNSQSTLRSHITRTHFQNTKMQCLFCLRFGGSEEEISDHIWAEHDADYNHEHEIKRSLPCPKCDDRFLDLTQLQSHYGKDHASKFDEIDGDVSICQHCGEMVQSSKFKKHMDGHQKKLIKTEHKPRKCEFCDYVANNKTDLTFHLLRHASKEQLQCDIEGCTFKTNYKSSLESHKVIKHKPRETLQCSKCPYQSSNKYLMKYHEDEHLTGRKKYNCDKCSYSTHLPASISQHRYKHLEAKSFKCDQCSFATKYNTSLRQHIVKKHSDLVID